MLNAYIGLGSNLGDRAGNLLLGIRGMLDAGLEVVDFRKSTKPNRWRLSRNQLFSTWLRNCAATRCLLRKNSWRGYCE